MHPLVTTANIEEDDTVLEAVLSFGNTCSSPAEERGGVGEERKDPGSAGRGTGSDRQKLRFAPHNLTPRAQQPGIGMLNTVGTHAPANPRPRCAQERKETACHRSEKHRLEETAPTLITTTTNYSTPPTMPLGADPANTDAPSTEIKFSRFF